MNKIVYKPYHTYRDRLAKLATHTVSKKVRKAHSEDFMKYIMNVSLSQPGMLATMDSNVLVDEESYVENGCRTYFPESPALLEMLWRAKMDVDLNDLDLSVMPPVFSIAWPRAEIAGTSLIGCMVAIYPNTERAKAVERFGRKYFGYPLELVTGNIVSNDEIGIHISYSGEKPYIGNLPAVYRCSIPSGWLKECLRGDVDFDAKLRTYRNQAFMAVDLDKEETYQQYVMCKLIIHLLVYMQACPEMIADGYPEGRKAREYQTRYSGKISPTVLSAPVGLKGSHASPDAHWRNPHFRSYPRRRDGGKKKGIVHVKGTMVNADIDPRTVHDDKLEVTVP